MAKIEALADIGFHRALPSMRRQEAVAADDRFRLIIKAEIPQFFRQGPSSSGIPVDRPSLGQAGTCIIIQIPDKTILFVIASAKKLVENRTGIIREPRAAFEDNTGFDKGRQNLKQKTFYLSNNLLNFPHAPLNVQ